MLVKCVLLLLCYHLLLGGAVSEFIPNVYPAKVVSSSQCGQHNPLHDEQLRQALQPIKQHISNRHTTSNYSSCKSIIDDYPSVPSDYYNINSTNGSAVQVYCDMEGTHCRGEGGWTRVAYVDMTQAGAICPQGLEQMSYSGSSYCGRFFSGVGCSSALLDTTISYQQVCGRVAGYQDNTPHAFKGFNDASINGIYLDGISITHGSPRKHLWSYAVGFTEQQKNLADCPCNNGSTVQVPSYVGNDYYCESGNIFICFNHNVVLEFPEDPLWDGQQCGGVEAPCCTHSNMPWFIKTLNETTTEDIELRACSTSAFCHGIGSGAALFLIEIYVR